MYWQKLDVIPQDYQAWYRLGQTYKTFGKILYTLLYFQKVSSLQLRNARIWVAVKNYYKGKVDISNDDFPNFDFDRIFQKF